MKRNTQRTLVGLVVMFGMTAGLFAAPAEVATSADSGFYVTASGGMQHRKKTVELGGTQWTSWNNDYVANLALGYQFSRYFRSELECTQLENDANRNKAQASDLETEADGTVTFRTATLNGYFDYPIEGTKLTAFLGGGVGLWRAELSGLTSPELERLGIAYFGGRPLVLSDNSDVKFGFQFCGGFAFGLTDNVDLFVEYRYFHGRDYDLSFPEYGITVDVPAPVFRMVQMGLRYQL